MKPYLIFLQRNGTYFLNKPRILQFFSVTLRIISCLCHKLPTDIFPQQLFQFNTLSRQHPSIPLPMASSTKHAIK